MMLLQEHVLKKSCSKRLRNNHIKHLRWILFLKQVATFQPCNFVKERLQHGCFHENIPINISKNTYFEEHLRAAASDTKMF